MNPQLGEIWVAEFVDRHGHFKERKMYRVGSHKDRRFGVGAVCLNAVSDGCESQVLYPFDLPHVKEWRCILRLGECPECGKERLWNPGADYMCGDCRDV